MAHTSLPISEGDQTDAYGIPLPLAFGGIGLLLALSFPGGLSGGSGFLIGFVIGICVLLFAATVRTKQSAAASAHETTCPHCGYKLIVSEGNVLLRDNPESRDTHG